MPTPGYKLTQDQTKHHNQRLVLRIIYNAGNSQINAGETISISRADIARITGLTRTTTSSAVAELLAKGLVAEIGQGPSAGGKPPTLLKVADDARAIIGVDLAGKEIQGGIFDLRGRKQHHIRLPRMNGLQTDEVIALIDQLMAAVNRPLLGIGVGLPGLIDAQSGHIQQAATTGWRDWPLGEILQKRYPAPVFMLNDSQAAALAQRTFGDGNNGSLTASNLPANNLAEASNLAVILAGRGISAGIVLDGRVYQGAGYAGASEIGHLRVVEGGELCVCGRFGCLETVASEGALLRWAQILFHTDPTSLLHDFATDAHQIDLEIVHQALQAGDPAVRQMIDRVARYLGLAAAPLAAVLNLPRIILAGSLARFGPDFAAAIQTEMRQRLLAHLATKTQIEISTLGDDIVMLGTAALVLANQLGVV